MHYFVFSTCFEKKRELYNEKIASLELSILLIPTSSFGNEMFGYRLF